MKFYLLSIEAVMKWDEFHRFFLAETPSNKKLLLVSISILIYYIPLTSNLALALCQKGYLYI